MLDLVIFDADGVLFDSVESNIAYYNAIFAEIGEPPLSPDEERACIFLAAMSVFELRAREDLTRLARMREVARTMDFTPFFELLRPPFELRPFLLGLKPRYRVALATNRSATTFGLIEHLGLGGVFDAVASAFDKVRPKPAPDIVSLCLERAGVRARTRGVRRRQPDRRRSGERRGRALPWRGPARRTSASRGDAGRGAGRAGAPIQSAVGLPATLLRRKHQPNAEAQAESEGVAERPAG